MDGVILDVSKVRLCAAEVAAAPFTNLRMGLFISLSSIDHTTPTSTILFNELSLAGYARQLVTGWGTPVLTSDFHALVNASAVSFHNTSLSNSALITGWFLFDVVAAQCVSAGLYDNPFVILPGTVYVTTPFWKLTGEIGHEP